jgi:hypothetical protein
MGGLWWPFSSTFSSMVFLGRKFSHVFNLKNMICTQTKDLGGKNGLNSSDFDF